MIYSNYYYERTQYGVKLKTFSTRKNSHVPAPTICPVQKKAESTLFGEYLLSFDSKTHFSVPSSLISDHHLSPTRRLIL